MLKVECEFCKAPYQVDERRVPDAGLKMRCPKCGNSFVVTDPSRASAKGASPARGAKPTMVGFQPSGDAKAVGAPTKPPPPLRKTPVSVVQAAPLPDGVTEAPPVRAPVHSRPTPRAFLAVTDEGVVALPASKKGGANEGKSEEKAALPAPVARSEAERAKSFAVTSPGLPAVSPSAKAAAMRERSVVRSVPPVLAPPTKPPPAPSFELDLPDARPEGRDLPVARGGGGFDIDLPATSKGTDLPATRSPLNAADLPLTKPGAKHDLPSIKPSAPGAGLPAAKGTASGLPATKSGAAGRATFDSLELPAVAGPRPAPAPVEPGSTKTADANVPTMAESLGLDALDAAKPADAAPAAPQARSFGELDLPVVGPPIDIADRPVPGFGELDLGPRHLSLSGTPSAGADAAGGAAKGESPFGGGLALRTDGANAERLAPPVARAAGTGAHARVATPRPSRKGPKIALAVTVAVVLGGAALQLTPLGAFGHLAIADKLHAADYAKEAAEAATAAHKKMAADTFSSAREAADDLAQLHDRSPRSLPAAAIAAFVEFENQVRFGPDVPRATRAKSFLAEIPADVDVPYAAAARAAASAADGDWSAAKSKAEAASSRESNDGVKFDLDVLQGLSALARKDAAAALQAFGAAVAKDDASPRAHWGLAQAHLLAKDLDKVKQEVDATIRLSPTHAGARTLHAWHAWTAYHDGAAALAELDTVLDDPSKASMSAAEIGQALAYKGTILLALERGAEARVAFERAVTADPRNIAALVGQGQNLYASGRYTEALTRFDDAVVRDPSNVAAIVGSAMAKISLERFDDAKKQLAAARKIDPNDMTIALWLAKAEDALGDRAAAETDYALATTLARPDNPDAVQAYASFAAFLASQGRTAEAQAKLDEARKKFQDSSTLDRAFGDISAAQGKFDDAVSYYMAALKKSANDLATRFRLGVAYRKMRKFDLATAEFDKIVEADKDYPGIALERGLLFEESGNVEKALEQFRSAYQKAPNDPDLALRVGAALVTIGKVDEGLPLLAKVKEKRPDSAEVNHYLGRAYLKKGGVEAAQAMRLLQRAAELDPNRAEYQLYVAWAANEAVPPQLGLARASIEKALSLDKLLADAYWQRGVLELREGAIDDAIKDLKHALELKPGRFEAYAALAECYEQKNDSFAAATAWQKAISGDDTRPFWRYHYGKLLLERGQAGEAARHLTFALTAAKKLEPKPGWLQRLAFDTGEALRKTGQKKDAIDAYELYMSMATPTAPDRKDAIAALKSLGAASASTY